MGSEAKFPSKWKIKSAVQPFGFKKKMKRKGQGTCVSHVNIN